nr:hypothetical protein L204_02792 [Cryptococcus depauperatus CBS 7855]
MATPVHHLQDPAILNEYAPIFKLSFYPFNFGKPAGRFGILGNYVADWKHFRMYLVNDTPVSRDLGGQLSARTVRWKDIEKMNGRPVVYVAQGNHGNWPQPGDHVYAETKQMTKDQSGILTTESSLLNIGRTIKVRAKSIISIMMPGEISRVDGATKVIPTVDGMKLWISAKLWMPRQVLIENLGPTKATVSTESDYTFRVRSPVMNWTMDHGFSQYKLSRDDDQDMYDGNVQLAGTKGSTVFRGIEKHSVRCRLSVSAPFLTHRLVDDFARNTVRGYKISLCLYNGQYLTTSGERHVCAYEPGKNGFKTASAVSLDDIDDWKWSY